MTDAVTDLGTPSMTGAEFRVACDWLGLSLEVVADLLEVNLRTVARWAYGHKSIPPGVAEEVEGWLREASTEVLSYVANLGQEPRMVVFRNDEEFRAARPDSDKTAAWHRAVAWRVSRLLPGLELAYAE